MLVVSFFIPAEIVMGDENNRLLLLTASLSYVGISTNLANLHFRRQINSISLCRASASPKQLRSHRPPRFYHPRATWDRRGSTIAALSCCVDEKVGIGTQPRSRTHDHKKIAGRSTTRQKLGKTMNRRYYQTAAATMARVYEIQRFRRRYPPRR